VQKAIRLLDEAGETPWLVGGATRDLLLEREVKDFDLAIAGDGLKWARHIADALGGAFVPLDEERGVGRVVTRFQGKPLWIDLARFRGQGGPGQPATLEEDLRLRDFTVNAIGIHPVSGEVVDPTGGLADLERGLLRATGPRAFHDDPLRVLRAVRLHATRSLSLEPETWQAMREAASSLRHVAAERVREEWMALLAPPGAMARVEMLDDLHVLDVVVPELLEGKGVTQSPPHSEDVFRHNLLVLDAMEQLWPWQEDSDFWQGGLSALAGPMREHLQEEIAHALPRWLLLKHMALLHDVAKPRTRSVGDDGRIHYYRHEDVGARMIEKIMRRMKFAARAVDYARVVVRHHLRPLQLSHRLPPSPRATYRFFRDARDTGPDIALHSVADQRGKAFASDRAEVIASVTHLLTAYFEEPERFVHTRPLLDGNEIMELTGLSGPPIGELIELLREQQAEGKVQTLDDAAALVKAQAQKLGQGDNRRQKRRG
jgi:tRNA nucleotidyltransferase/poly(A) polymerase